MILRICPETFVNSSFWNFRGCRKTQECLTDWLRRLYMSWNTSNLSWYSRNLLQSFYDQKWDLKCKKMTIIMLTCIFKWKIIILHEQRTLKPRGSSNIKMAQNIMSLEFNFRRGLFCAKMQNSKIFIWPPLWNNSLWGDPVPQRDLRPKNS